MSEATCRGSRAPSRDVSRQRSRSTGGLEDVQLELESHLSSSNHLFDNPLVRTDSKVQIVSEPRRADQSNSSSIGARPKMFVFKSKYIEWKNSEFFAEFVGTFILMTFNNGIIGTYILSPTKFEQNPLAMGLVAGIGAMLGIMASLPISGGHINPAVTVAFAVTGKLSWKKVPHYLVGQYLGSFVSQVLLFAMYYNGINALDGGVRSAFGSATSTGMIFATYPPPHTTVLTALIDQIWGTAMLLLSVCAISDARGIKLPLYLQPVIICFLVTGLASGTSHNCGATLNPARDLAPRILTAIAGYGWEPFQPMNGHYWYVAGLVGPHVGAIVGCYVYSFMISSYLADKAVEVPALVNDSRNNSLFAVGDVDANFENGHKPERSNSLPRRDSQRSQSISVGAATARKRSSLLQKL